MNVYSDVEAGEKLPVVLEDAERSGAVRIRRYDGQEFVVHPLGRPDSPLNVRSLGLDISVEEIVQAVREGRERWG